MKCHVTTKKKRILKIICMSLPRSMKVKHKPLTFGYFIFRSMGSSYGNVARS